MTHENDRVLKNYRLAESIRKEQERADARRLEEETRLAIRRAHNADGRYESLLRNTKELPAEFMERVVSYMVRKTIETMVTERRVLDALVHRFMEDVIIRISEYNPGSVQVEIRNGDHTDDPVITVSIPEFRMTRVLNDMTVTDLVGRVGPVVMPDRPIHVVQASAPTISYTDPQEVFSEVEHKIV